jgi:MFS family permease
LDVAGLAVACIALAGFAGNPLGGWLSDRLGARRTLMVGLALSVAGSGAMCLVEAEWHAFAAAAAVGLGAAVCWPSQDTLLATLVPPEQRSSAFGVRYATMNVGLAAGALLAGLLVDGSTGRFQLLFALQVAAFAAFGLILLRIAAPGRARPALDTAARGARAGFRHVLRDGTFRHVWVLTALLVVVGYAQSGVFLPAFATGEGEIALGLLGLLLAVNALTVAAAQLVSLRLLRGRRRTRGLLLTCGCWALAWLVALAAGHAGGGAAALGAFAAAMALLAVGETLLSPTLPPLVNDLAPEQLRGRYNGMYTMAWTTGFAAGPAIGGGALASGLATPLLLGLVAGCVVAALGTLRLERRLSPAANLVPA